jgi:hypothetical protein
VGTGSAIEEPGAAVNPPSALEAVGDSVDGPNPSSTQEGSDVLLAPEASSEGSVEAVSLFWPPIALAALALGAVFLFALRRRSKREKDSAPPPPAPAVEDVAVAAPLIAAGGQAGDGDWTRDLLTLDPPGAIDGIVAGSDRLVGFGQAASGNGDAAQAAVWDSSDGIDWRRVATLGPGIARLAVPWLDGFLVAAVHGVDEGIGTTCWWIDGAGEASEQTGGEEPLRGVVEGGTAIDGMAILWGKVSEGPRVWVAEDGATWRESDLQGAVDLVANSGGSFVAFGRRRLSRPSVAYSADGISWNESNVDDPIVFEGARMVAAMPFKGRFVAAGTDIMRGAAATWTTEDGRHWNRTALPSTGSAHVVDLILSDDRLLVVGGVRYGGRKSVAVWESRDGVSWRSAGTPKLFADASASGAAVVGDSIVVSGTLYVENDDAQLERVPVSWRSRVSGNGGPPAEQPVSQSATEDPEPMPTR